MRLLTFDGGGVLGIGPAHFLELYEREIGKPTYIGIDGFAGTSTGSIIAAGLAVGMSGADIVAMYKSEVPRIFKKRPWWKRGFTGPTYDTRNLREVIESIFLDRTFHDLTKHLLIPASDFLGDGDKQDATNFYSAQDTPDMKIAEAVIRSCSAPTYFAPIDGRYADGGLFANNPSMAMITYLTRLDYPRHEIKLLSFATGGLGYKSLNPSPLNPVTLARNIIDYMMAAASARVVHKYCKHSGLGFYQRIGPKDKGPALDSLKSMDSWMRAWRRLYSGLDAKALFGMRK